MTITNNPIKMSDFRCRPLSGPSFAGGDNDAIFTELGFDADTLRITESAASSCNRMPFCLQQPFAKKDTRRNKRRVSFCIFMPAHEAGDAAASFFLERRHLSAAEVVGMGTSGAEGAAGGRVYGAWDFP